MQQSGRHRPCPVFSDLCFLVLLWVIHCCDGVISLAAFYNIHPPTHTTHSKLASERAFGLFTHCQCNLFWNEMKKMGVWLFRAVLSCWLTERLHIYLYTSPAADFIFTSFYRPLKTRLNVKKSCSPSCVCEGGGKTGRQVKTEGWRCSIKHILLKVFTQKLGGSTPSINVLPF